MTPTVTSLAAGASCASVQCSAEALLSSPSPLAGLPLERFETGPSGIGRVAVDLGPAAPVLDAAPHERVVVEDQFTRVDARLPAMLVEREAQALELCSRLLGRGVEALDAAAEHGPRGEGLVAPLLDEGELLAALQDRVGEVGNQARRDLLNRPALLGPGLGRGIGRFGDGSRVFATARPAREREGEEQRRGAEESESSVHLPMVPTDPAAVTARDVAARRAA